MTEVEKLAKKIFDECAKDGEPVTVTEAMEMAEMELKSAKVNKKVTEKSKKERKPRVYVASNEKKEIFSEIYDILSSIYQTNIVIPDKKIQILLNNKSFTLDLVENRPKKS